MPHVFVVLNCVHVNAVPEEGSRFPGAGIIGTCELLYSGAGN